MTLTETSTLNLITATPPDPPWTPTIPAVRTASQSQHENVTVFPPFTQTSFLCAGAHLSVPCAGLPMSCWSVAPGGAVPSQLSNHSPNSQYSVGSFLPDQPTQYGLFKSSDVFGFNVLYLFIYIIFFLPVAPEMRLLKPEPSLQRDRDLHENGTRTTETASKNRSGKSLKPHPSLIKQRPEGHRWSANHVTAGQL